MLLHWSLRSSRYQRSRVHKKWVAMALKCNGSNLNIETHSCIHGNVSSQRPAS